MADAVGWYPNLERLRHEAQLAANGHAIDPWAVVEARCWLGIIDAENSAKIDTEQSSRTRPTGRLALYRDCRLRTSSRLTLGVENKLPASSR